MLWPAVLNRYPLLYPDSITYLGDGRQVARAVFLHKFSEYYGIRSFFYSLGILPFHGNLTAWPVIVLQSLLAAYVLWLVVRSFHPRRTALHYLILVPALSLLTSMSWFLCLIMPDVLGPILYLCIYLLVLAPETLSRAERFAVILIAWWGIVSHATHFALASGLCLLLAMLWALRLPALRGRLSQILQVAAIILCAAAAQMVLHAYLYGEPSLNGERPPFFTARVLADGPGLWYLQQHCGEAQVKARFVLCDHLQELPQDPDEFLWGEHGIWSQSDDDTGLRIRQEETAFVLATLRAYPGAQLSKSAANFWQQLQTFGLYLFGPSDWMSGQLPTVLPRERSQYLASRQAQDALPLEFFTSVQNWTVIVSLVVIVALAVWMRLPRRPQLFGLALVIISTVLANALVNGAMSLVEDRLQSRVVWLVPFLAGILISEWTSEKHNAGTLPPSQNFPNITLLFC